MAIRVGWRNASQSQLYVQFIGRWTTDELEAAANQWHALLVETEAEMVDTIVNLVDSAAIPEGFVRTAHRLAQRLPVKSGRMVITGADSQFGHLLLTLIRSNLPTYARNVHFVDTLNDADALLDG